MKLSEQEKEDILSKYVDNTSDDILVHLKRHYPFKVLNQPEWMEKPIKIIDVGEKSYWVEGNKKFLVNRIASILSNERPGTDISIIRRTIKKYLDGILSIE